MCGIAGIVHLDGSRAADSGALQRMTGTIVHRGPDDEGFYVDGPVGLGVRRLSIVDRAFGHQPLSGEDGNTWIVFNGEIYNHPDLCEQLAARGHRYRTRCDTETVVHAYEEYGERMVEQLRGMFAFALWDRARKRVLLYRDRLGIKPLYYARWNNTLLFSSEVKAILEYGVPFDVNESVMECYLRLGYVPGERTLFTNVFKLLPGHYLAANVGTGDMNVQRYWELCLEPNEDLQDKECEQEFERLMFETVAQHRLGEVAQGIFLSGGVDSSSLVAVTKDQVEEPSMTFSIGYADEEFSELSHARNVAKHFGTRHFEYELSGQKFADMLPKMMWHMDEPVAEMAAIPLYCIAQLAREHITVVHSGEGADEILAGYGVYSRMQTISRWQELGGSFLSGMMARLLSLPEVPHRLRRYGELLDKPIWERYQGVRSSMSGAVLRGIGRNGFPGPEHWEYRTALFQDIYKRAQRFPLLNQMLFSDFHSWLPDDLLVKADKMTMAASIELRVPFLDHKIVEFAGRLPCRLKLTNGQSKYLLKKIMRKHLPGQVLDARKRGFLVPVHLWLRGDLLEASRKWLLDSEFLSRYFVREKLEELLKTHQNGKADASTEIYALVCLAVWHEVFQGKYGRTA
jgi:asparagine synthase (glutamine-hydrolysing)